MAQLYRCFHYIFRVGCVKNYLSFRVGMAYEILDLRRFPVVVFAVESIAHYALDVGNMRESAFMPTKLCIFPPFDAFQRVFVA